MSTDANYEQTARYYDAAYASVPTLGPDAQFYADLAAELGGPVLELGCGTGRVLLPIAAQGIQCVGLDASPVMLAHFQRKPAADRATLVCSRMESFDLGDRRFTLIFSAFRAFQHLDTVEQQLACLARVRAHLAPGGVFSFDVFNPRPERMAQDNEPETLDLTFDLEGHIVRRFTQVTRDRATQIMQVRYRYVDDTDNGVTEETRVSFTMRWFWRYELEHLLHRAGFTEVTLFGDFDRSPVRSNSPAFVIVAR